MTNDPHVSPHVGLVLLLSIRRFTLSSDNLHAFTRMPSSAPQRQEHTGELLDRHFQLIAGIGREPHQETSLVFGRRMQRRQTQEINAGPARSINGLALGNVADEDTGQESG